MTVNGLGTNLLLCEQMGVVLILFWSQHVLYSIPQLCQYLAVLEPLPTIKLPIFNNMNSLKSMRKQNLSKSTKFKLSRVIAGAKQLISMQF